MTAVPIRRRPADEVLEEQWPILAADMDVLLQGVDDRVDRINRMGTAMSVGLSVDRLIAEVRALRNLDAVVTSFMLGRCGGRAVAEAQREVRELRP